MFKCKECKKWLKSTTVDTKIEKNNKIIKVKNMPAKICPKCGKIYIYDIILK